MELRTMQPQKQVILEGFPFVDLLQIYLLSGEYARLYLSSWFSTQKQRSVLRTPDEHSSLPSPGFGS